MLNVKELQRSLITFTVPESYVKRIRRSRILTLWKEYCNTSTKDRCTQEFVAKVSLQLYNLTPHIARFLTGHGPFMTYLEKIKRVSSNLCESEQAMRKVLENKLCLFLL